MNHRPGVAKPRREDYSSGRNVRVRCHCECGCRKAVVTPVVHDTDDGSRRQNTPTKICGKCAWQASEDVEPHRVPWDVFGPIN